MSRLISAPFNPIEEFQGEHRCIASDLRNANDGQSSGPLEIERSWDSYTDDHLGLMDHLGIEKFMGAHSRCPGHALTPTGVMAIRCKQFHLPDL